MNVSNYLRCSISTVVSGLAFALVCVCATAQTLRAQPLGVDTATIIVWYHPDTSMATVKTAVGKIGGFVRDSSRYFHRLTVRIDRAKVPQILGAPWCLSVSGPMRPEPHWEDRSRRAIGADISLPVPYGVASAAAVTGAGVAVGIWDAGAPYPHVGFVNRLHVMESITGCAVESKKHYTHVTGIVGGDGEYGYPLRKWNGVAPGAELYAYNAFSPGADANYCYVDDSFPEDEVVGAADSHAIVVAQNSWGLRPDNLTPCADFGAYSGWCADYDHIVRNAAVTVVFSAGNFRASCADFPCSPKAAAGYGLLMPPATAMNIITVGALEQDGTPAYYSSWGPTRDGRLKPDIVAVGSGVYSSVPSAGNIATNAYDTLSGTSMACPMVTGAAALLVQAYRNISPHDADFYRPEPALIKAVLLNTADDVADPGPDYKTGFGRLNVWRALRAMSAGRFRVMSINPSQEVTTVINVLPTCSLKVMMVYSDPVATSYGNGTPLRNDLDLWLQQAGSTTIYRPLVLDPAHPAMPAVPGVDARNNVEQVVIANPPPGNWEIHLKGTSVPDGPQTCAVTWEGNTDPAADLCMRDQDVPLDLGDEPNSSTGPMWESPDIWVRNAPDGATHQHEHQSPNSGAKNYVYVKVRNRGCGAADGRLHLYWSKSSTASIWPDHWNGGLGCNGAPWGGEIGPSQAVAVPGFGEQIVQFEWTPPDPARYSGCGADATQFGLLARIETSSSWPYGMTIVESPHLEENVRANNNIVWKNVNVVRVGRTGGGGTILVRNLEARTRFTDFVISMPRNDSGRTLADVATVELSGRIYDLWKRYGQYEPGVGDTAGVPAIRLTRPAVTIRGLPLESNEEFPVAVNIRLRRGALQPTEQFQLSITQEYGRSNVPSGTRVGGGTFNVSFADSGSTHIVVTPIESVAGEGVAVMPNPAVRSATVEYVVAAPGHVRLELRDAAGRLVRSIADGDYRAGRYREDVSVEELFPGVYFCSMITTSGTTTARFVVAR